MKDFEGFSGLFVATVEKVAVYAKKISLTCWKWPTITNHLFLVILITRATNAISNLIKNALVQVNNWKFIEIMIEQQQTWFCWLFRRRKFANLNNFEFQWLLFEFINSYWLIDHLPKFTMVKNVDRKLIIKLWSGERENIKCKQMLEIWIGVENLKKGGSRKCSYVEFLSFLYKKR